ncbi:MAG TPA: disulfide oxidoreductase [Candidatus Limnocylindrales bacterium]|nr:disulfide oxidoreductase [Candidatus Limnocylindrales bacterium]
MDQWRRHEPPARGGRVNVLVVSTFLAILVVVAIGGVALTLAFSAMDRARLLPGLMEGVSAVVRPAVLWLAFLVVLTATLGSLYFSEVAGFTPCVLCWYQRIAMYPLVVLLGLAAVRGDPTIRRYAGPIAGIGALVSLYHVGVERLPGLPTGSCSVTVPCDLVWFERFGFITLPVMALAGFVAVLTLLFAYAGSGPPREESSA